MKLAKLSLAAIAAVSLSTGVFAADSLSSALTSGKVSGTLQAYYFNTKKTPGNSNNITDLGLDLSYTTAAFNGFTAGFTFQGTNTPWGNATDNAAFSSTMYGTGAVLSEAYLEYANSGAFIKAGRQYINTPLVAGSGSRITRESFEGYVAGYTGLPNTVIAGGYVTKMQRRTDFNGNIGKFSADNVAATGANDPSVTIDGAWTIFVKNNSIKGLALTAAYAHAKVTDVNPDIWYAEAAYGTSLSGAKVGVAAQYYKSSSDLNNVYDNNYVGLKVSAAMNGLSGFLAYSTVNDNGANAEGVLTGIGNGTGLEYTSSFFASEEAALNNEKAYAFGLAYNFSQVGVNGLKAKALYNKFNRDGDNDANAYGVGAYYSFAGVLKGLGSSVEYEKINNDQTPDSAKVRVKLNYKF